MFFYLIEIALGVCLVVFIVTQITIPAVNGREWFPILRRDSEMRRLKAKLARRQADLERANLEVQIAQLEAELAQREAQGELISADALRKRIETLRQNIP